jgi:lysophospholipase L1-like esterase
MVWYQDDVEGVITERNKVLYQPETIFYGSSTIRLWDTLYEDFKDYKPVNLGFGGSTLAACGWFFDDIAAPVKGAKKFILYAGDNDLGDGKHPEEVCIFYRYFLIKLREHFPVIPLYFISVKPSIEREEIMDKIIETNRLIEEDINRNDGNEFFIDVFSKMINHKGAPIRKYFDADGLHLSNKGYEVWKDTILNECLLEK